MNTYLLDIWPYVSLIRFALLLLPIGMTYLILREVWAITPHVPIQDEWENLLMVHHYQMGSFSVGELWAFHNQHRIFFPRGIDLIITEMTHYNRQVMMTVDAVFGALTTALLFSAARKSQMPSILAWALLIPFSLATLSFAQWENWLQPFQLTFILTIFGVAITVRGLAEDRNSTIGFVIALAGSVIAALSSLGGCAALLAFFPSVLRSGWKRVAIWAVVSLGILIPYFRGFPHSDVSFQLVGTVQYMLTYLGGPVAVGHVSLAQISAALSIVIALVCVTLYWLRHRTLEPLNMWTGLALFGLGAAGMTALGRNASGDLIYAFSSRYQAFSGVWWVTVFALAAMCMLEWNVARTSVSTSLLTQVVEMRTIWLAVGAIASVVALVLMALNQQASLPYLKNFQLYQRQQEQCIVLYLQSPPPCFQYYYPTSGKAQAYSAMMQQDGLGPFYQPTGNVGVDPATVPAGALRLDRYVDHAAGTYWTVVALNKDQWDSFLGPNYQLDAHIGYLLAGPQAAPAGVATHPIYGCVLNSVEFLSNDITCGGGGLLQVEGWAYDAAPVNVHTVPLFECLSAQRNIVSNAPQCPAGTTGIILGFARENP